AVVDRLPRTPHGKLDRAALRQVSTHPPTADRDRDRDHAAAERRSTPIQREVAEIWRSVLGVKDVAPEDDFFDLGGHSLLAARLFAQIEDRLGVRLPLTSLFPD